MIRVSLQRDAEIRSDIESIEEMYKHTNIIIGADLEYLTSTIRKLLGDIYVLQSKNETYFNIVNDRKEIKYKPEKAEG